MIGIKSLTTFAALFSVVYATALPAPEDEWHLTLLKRQAPGTPSYDCHLACGTAITLSKAAGPCTNDAFLADYAECLACAGPSDLNIWRYYGATLTTAGTACGLSTTPGAAQFPATTSSSLPITSSSSPRPTTSTIAASTSSAPSTPVSVSTTVVPTHAPSSTIPVTTSAAANSTSTTVPFAGGANSVNVQMIGALAVAAGAVFAAAL